MSRARHLSKVTPSAEGLIGSEDLTNTAISGALGYTPANKAGDTLTGTFTYSDLLANAIPYLNANKELSANAALSFNGTVLSTTTLDLTNLEVTNIKAKDGTASLSIADSTGILSISANPILSGGTANGLLYLNGSKVATSGSALTFDGTKLNAASSADAPVSLFGVSNATTGGNATLNIAAASTQYAFPSVRGDTVLRAESNSLVFGTASEFKWGSTGAEWMRLTSTGLEAKGKLLVGYSDFTNIPTNGAAFAGSVGIGTNNPAYKLDVVSTTTDNIIRVFANSATQGSRLEITNGNGISGVNYSYIRFINNKTTVRDWRFGTYGSDALQIHDATAGASRLAVDTNGSFGVGTNPYSFAKITADVSTTSVAYRVMDQNNNQAGGTNRYAALAYYARRDNIPRDTAPLSDYGATAAIVFTDRPGTANYPNAVRTSDVELWTATNTGGTGLDAKPNRVAAFTADGIFEIPYGKIKFPSSQIASTDANTLDDYEEGTWTPLIGSDSTGSFTMSIQFGRYTKVGRVVTFTAFMQWSARVSGGNIVITGFPFAINNGGTPGGTAATAFKVNSATDTILQNASLSFDQINDAAAVYAYNYGRTGLIVVDNLSASGFIAFNGSYFVS